jgi:hypothetical protein
MEIPDSFMVAIVTDHFEVTLQGTKRAWQTQDMIPMTRANWESKFGKIDEADEKEYWTYGCLRYHQVLHHYDI